MGAPSAASTDRPDAGRRTIRSALSATVVVPALCLLLLWLAVAAVALGSAMMGRGYFAQHRDVADIGVAALGVVVLLIVVVLAGSFARRLSSDAMSLAATAGRLASQPGGAAPGGRDAAPRPRRQTAEMAQSEAAITSLHQTATSAAASEAGLRNGLREVFVSMARRNQSLLQRQLRLIDALEQKASDPAALADLFSLDHLTTRMRRHAESLAILSGAAPGRAWREPVPVIDVIRGAMAEVEDYKRVTVLTRSEDSITGPAVADMIHLIAELIENATLFSPSGTRVEVRAGRVANGFAVEIDDRGLGVEPAQLAEINRQLASPPDFDLANADRLGLFVGGKLAARHAVRVSLRASPYGGTTAIVLMPISIVVPAPGSLDGAGLPEATAPDGSRMGALRADALRADAARPAAAQPDAAQPGTAQPEAADAASHQAGLSARGAEAVAMLGRHSPSPAGQPAPGGQPAAADDTPEGRLPGARIPRPDLPTRRSLHRRAGAAGGPSPVRPAPPGRAPASPSSAPPFPNTAPPSPSRSPAPASPGPAPAAPSSAPVGRNPSPSAPTAGAAPAAGPQPPAAASVPGDAGVSLFTPRTPRSSRPAAGTGRSGGSASAASASAGSLFEKRAAPGSPPAAPSANRAPSATPVPGATPAPSATPAPGVTPAADGPAADGTYRGLPRRTKQASLSPHLRGGSPASRSADRSPPSADPPAPEQARSFAASLQNGWLRGREETPQQTPHSQQTPQQTPQKNPERTPQLDPQEDPEAPQSEDGQ